MEVDFGYNNDETIENEDVIKKNSTNENEDDSTDLSTNKKDSDKTDLNNVDNEHANDNVNETVKSDDTVKEENNTDIEYKEGTVIETENGKYTFDKDKNLLDEQGNIFKKAEEVKEWLSQFDFNNEETDTISIDAIKKAVGIDLVDDNNEPLNFENTTAGVVDYINNVIETKKEEYQTMVLDTLFNRYPILEDVLDYYIANGNSLEGFNEIVDRSNIKINENDEIQQENIIKSAWKEQNRKGDIDNYIQYLKSSGKLLEVAKLELESLIESDNQKKKLIQEEADRKENERIEKLKNYWNNIYNTIKSGKIAGYSIPNVINIKRNGKEISVTPDDFFNYIYRVDEQGKSDYEKDLLNESEENNLNDLLLRAYLKFVGGDYSNLVNMAINKKEVETLKAKAKIRKNNYIKVKPSTKTNNNNIDFGYND